MPRAYWCLRSANHTVYTSRHWFHHFGFERGGFYCFDLFLASKLLCHCFQCFRVYCTNGRNNLSFWFSLLLSTYLSACLSVCLYICLSVPTLFLCLLRRIFCNAPAFRKLKVIDVILSQLIGLISATSTFIVHSSLALFLLPFALLPPRILSSFLLAYPLLPYPLLF